jgi:hypothetical protein
VYDEDTAKEVPMFRFIALLAVLGHCSLAANNPIREVTSQATRADNQLVPAFYKGYIYWVGLSGGNNSVTIYAPDGHLALSFVAENGPVDSIAVDTDGTVAVAWGSWASKNGGGIDFRDSSGTLMKTIQTGRYLPAHISFAEDHSLWSLGCQLDAAGPARPDRQDYTTVRKYLPSGKEAGSYLPRSLFPPGVMEPGDVSWQRSSSITVAHDRVGLWAYSGENDDQTEWVELDLNGNLLGRWRLDQFYRDTRIAYTSDGNVFVQSRDSKTNIQRLYTLDRASSTWQAVDGSPGGWLEAADGDALVFSEFVKPGPMHVRWYQHP